MKPVLNMFKILIFALVRHCLLYFLCTLNNPQLPRVELYVSCYEIWFSSLDFAKCQVKQRKQRFPNNGIRTGSNKFNLLMVLNGTTRLVPSNGCLRWLPVAPVGLVATNIDGNAPREPQGDSIEIIGSGGRLAETVGCFVLFCLHASCSGYHLICIISIGIGSIGISSVSVALVLPRYR